jgi:hypothetical protein
MTPRKITGRVPEADTSFLVSLQASLDITLTISHIAAGLCRVPRHADATENTVKQPC